MTPWVACAYVTRDELIKVIMIDWEWFHWSNHRDQKWDFHWGFAYFFVRTSVQWFLQHVFCTISTHVVREASFVAAMTEFWLHYWKWYLFSLCQAFNDFLALNRSILASAPGSHPHWLHNVLTWFDLPMTPKAKKDLKKIVFAVGAWGSMQICHSKRGSNIHMDYDCTQHIYLLYILYECTGMSITWRAHGSPIWEPSGLWSDGKSEGAPPMNEPRSQKGALGALGRWQDVTGCDGQTQTNVDTSTLFSGFRESDCRML